MQGNTNLETGNTFEYNGETYEVCRVYDDGTIRVASGPELETWFPDEVDERITA